MVQNMPKASITIPVGGMYQEWSCLMDLVEEDTAKPRAISRTYATLAKGVAETKRLMSKSLKELSNMICNMGTHIRFVRGGYKRTTYKRI